MSTYTKADLAAVKKRLLAQQRHPARRHTPLPKELGPLRREPPCRLSHPEVKLGAGVVVGGSARDPVAGCSIYVALDSPSPAAIFPWEGGVDIQFPIANFEAPKDAVAFAAMVTWLCNQLQNGKRIHVGCHAGHGRTGLLLAAVAAEMGKPDAIAWVRANYCSKAVETKEQIDFLVKHYGVTPAAPRYKPLPKVLATSKPHMDFTEPGWFSDVFGEDRPAPFSVPYGTPRPK